MNFLIHLTLVVCCTVAQKTPSTKSDKNNVSSTSSSSVTMFVATSPLSVETDDETLDGNVTTEMTLTTTCESNSSCSVSTTAKPNTNGTAKGLDNDTNKSVTRGKHYRTDLGPGKKSCVCNLQSNICDVNCCCDLDCSLDDKLIFHHCQPENFYYDTRYCDYMKYIYINNTPFQWHVNQNGLFCVLKSNLPPSHSLQRKQPLASFDIAQHEKISKFSWPLTPKREEVKFNMSEDFIYGNNVWSIHGNQIKKFQVPKKYFSNACIMKEDVLNLNNMENTCAQVDISEKNRHLHFRNYFQDVTVVANPNLLNISKYKNMQECPRNVCLVIVPKICDVNFNNCKFFSNNDTHLDFKCNIDLRKNKKDCKNAVKKLQYNFYHNGTKGYTKIELLGVVQDISFDLGVEDLELFQTFKINFWWVNQTRNYSSMFSGNPGYQTGKPILSGYLVNVGNASNITLKIQRNPNNYPENFLVLPENFKGVCLLNNMDYLPIEFGYNYLTTCKFSMMVFNRKKYYNATEICRDIQKTVLKVWGITGKNKTVGMFGNANANAVEDWIKIMYSLGVEKLLNKTTGRFSSANATLTCFGLVNSVTVDLFHSRVDFETLLSQEKILGVTYTFGEFVNKTLSYNKQKNSTFLELDLESRVVFYDISAQKRKKFVDPPSFEIKLPYDFFYPFIKIDNGVTVWSANISLHFIVSLIVLLVK